MRWQDQAKCAEIGDRPFFDVSDNHYSEARKICGGCMVRDICLAYALEMEKDSPYTSQGMFGGKSPNERRILNGFAPSGRKKKER